MQVAPYPALVFGTFAPHVFEVSSNVALKLWWHYDDEDDYHDDDGSGGGGGGDGNDLSNGKTGKGISSISGSNGTAKQKQKVEPEQYIW